MTIPKYFYLLVIAILAFSACKSSKKLTKSGPPPQRTQVEIVQALEKHNIDFDFVSVKGDVAVESPELSESASIQLRIKKDQLIWLVGKKFSIEGVRAIINKDSFYMVNRLEKYYHAEKNNMLKTKLGIDLAFEDIQQLFVGNIFLPSENEISNYTQTQDKCKLTANTAGFNVVYTIDAYDLNLVNIAFSDRSGRKVVVDLLDYKKVDNRNLAFTRNMSFQSKDFGTYQFNITVEEVEFNKEKAMTFSIPSHYEYLGL